MVVHTLNFAVYEKGVDLVWDRYGRYIRLVKNLPNSGSFWQKGRVRIAAGRIKSRITAHFFHNLGFSGFLGENGLFASRKNYPDRPFWLAILLFYGLE